jgi:hypothetical protein
MPPGNVRSRRHRRFDPGERGVERLVRSKAKRPEALADARSAKTFARPRFND